MLKRVGLFGIRRRINEIIEFLNGEEIDGFQLLDIGEWVEKANEKFEGGLLFFSDIFRKLAIIDHRLDQFDKWKANRMAAAMAEQIGEDVNDETWQHALKTIEGLEARVVSLEEALLLRNETPELSEPDHG
jgi:hypothetical protein